MASKKMFRVHALDCEGRQIMKYLGVFYALSETDARMKASAHYKNPEILSTGFYGAKPITQKELNNDKDRLTKEIIDRTTIIN